MSTGMLRLGTAPSVTRSVASSAFLPSMVGKKSPKRVWWRAKLRAEPSWPPVRCVRLRRCPGKSWHKAAYGAPKNRYYAAQRVFASSVAWAPLASP